MWFLIDFSSIPQIEPTIKLLRDRIKELEEKNEAQVISKLKEREKELQKSFTDKEEQYQSTQLDLAKKLGETEARLLTLQSQLQKSQTDLYEHKSKQDELLNAKSLEIDMLMQDIDKLNERVASAERLSDQYAKKLDDLQRSDNSREDTEASTAAAIEQEQHQQKLMGYQTTALEIELAAKEKEISQLVDDVQKLQTKSNKMREFYEKQRLELEDRLSGRERILEQLEYELKKKQDYDDVSRLRKHQLTFFRMKFLFYLKVKKELSILKSIEFNEHSNPVEPDQQQKPLEVLLLEKNRFLQNENTQIRNKLNDLQEKHDRLVRENSEQIKVNMEQKSLVIQLEKDLMRAAQRGPQQEMDLESPSTSMAMIGEENIPVHGTSVGEQPDASLFNIVSSQRERFRARVQELESENLSSKQQVIKSNL